MLNELNSHKKYTPLWHQVHRKHRVRNWHHINPLKSTMVSLLIFLLLSTAQAQGDLRCFLLQGGSVQNFFVNESLPIGSVIGDLNIGGDPSENGDIYLRLGSQESPVQILEYSKKLVLTEKLDKEGVTGKAHVVINVICQKKMTDDVDTRIPIVIRVTDSNDNAPVFYNAPYSINVSEATVVGTIILGTIFASDEDQKGPFSTVQYSIAPGPHSSKFSFESPISGDLKLTEPLDYEADSLFNLTIIAEDQGSPSQSSSTYLTIQVQDSDDQNPAFSRHRYMSFLPDMPLEGEYLEVQPGGIKAEDQDKGINSPVVYSLGNDVTEANLFGIEPKSGRVYFTRNIPPDSIRQPIALSVFATQIDNPDRVASSILVVSRRGATSTQLQFVQRNYEATVLESLPIGSLITQTLINKNEMDNLQFSISGNSYDTFHISSTGRITLAKNLDFETQKIHSAQILVNDGDYSDTANLTVNVLNVNDWDPRFKNSYYEFYVHKERLLPGDVIGNVVVADGDDDQIALSVRGKDAKVFDINASGDLMVRRLGELNSTEASILVVAKDSGIPPRQTSVPVTIIFPKGLVKSLPLQSTSSFLLMVIFGSLLFIFFIVITCLVIYIHKNKKQDDTKAALPTKMSQIMSNGAANKLDPLSPVQNHKHPITSIEGPHHQTANGLSTLQRTQNQGSLRASTISVRSHDNYLTSSSSLQGSRRYTRNPLSHGYTIDPPDNVSLNGSNATTASTATVGSQSPQPASRTSTPSTMTKIFTNKASTVMPASSNVPTFSTFDGTVRAAGGPPHKKAGNTITGVVPNRPQNHLWSHPTKTKPAPQVPQNGKIVWPSTSIPKKVKKLSWEDELGQTELNPEVSVAPYIPSTSHDTPNLTVYF